MATMNGITANVYSRDSDGSLRGYVENGIKANKMDGYKLEVPHGIMQICVKMVAYDELGRITGVYENPYDLGTKAFAQLIQNNILDTAESITDTTNTSRSLTVNSAATVPMIVAGTGTTAAAFTDYALSSIASGGTYGGSNSSGNQAATVNAISSNTFTVTATITNTSGSTIAYSEVGMAVTVATYTFLIAHDVFTALNVSNNGTLAVTYTLTFT